MQYSQPIHNDFLNKVREIIEENLSNEQFGVSELASKAGMSRSNLLRKIKKLTNISASQYIRNIRLEHAMEMLKQNSLNVSEVSYEVGFSSTSYFIKCFREYYGYPPGEAGKRVDTESEHPLEIKAGTRNRLVPVLISVVVLVVIFLLLLVKPFESDNTKDEKSIAVLPFINDSNDSANVHIINGLMESILNNLQKIEDLRVISRTSVEKYRNNPKTIPEMGEELNVKYFVEGSGQKIGDQILLTVQLIDASGDRHLWAEQYTREAKDIFKLQQEVAKSIATEIKAIITPEEEEQINKIPTENLVAYDYYLKGVDLMNVGSGEGLREAISFFEKAIEQDSEFAQAYANLAIVYYYLDVYMTIKQYTNHINDNADKALLYDPKLARSLIAKAMYHININEYKEAVPYLEKALEYNPNSAWVINFLAGFYTNRIPNTEKYLQYAIKGIQLDIAAQDSVTASYTYLHVSNALIQSGFIEEAVKYIDKSLEYNPENIFSQYVRAYILYAKNGNLKQTKELLVETLKKDTTRLDVMQEVGKIYYYMRDFESAYTYYMTFLDIKQALNLDIYRFENAKIGLVFDKIGLKEKSDSLFLDFLDYAEHDMSVYKHINLAIYYSYRDDTENAIKHLKLFSEEDNFFYWIILFLELDPLIDNIKNLPEFNEIYREIESNFRERHEQVKTSLEEKDLL